MCSAKPPEMSWMKIHPRHFQINRISIHARVEILIYLRCRRGEYMIISEEHYCLMTALT
jgi:hypothetical protein